MLSGKKGFTIARASEWENMAFNVSMTVENGLLWQIWAERKSYTAFG